MIYRLFLNNSEAWVNVCTILGAFWLTEFYCNISHFDTVDCTTTLAKLIYIRLTPLTVMLITSGVNLAGILGDDAGWIQGGCPLPRKKFQLKWCFGAFWAVLFVRVLARKNVEFIPPEVVIWWIQDVLLGNTEYCARIMGLISFLLHYCSVMQAI